MAKSWLGLRRNDTIKYIIEKMVATRKLSLILKRFEFAGAASILQSELPVLLLIDQAGVNELAH